jgi:hypothetical protein
MIFLQIPASIAGVLLLDISGRRRLLLVRNSDYNDFVLKSLK